MSRRHHTPPVGPEGAIRGFLNTFGDEWLRHPDKLVELINTAFDHPDFIPAHAAGRVFKLFSAMGFSREDLICAVGDIVSRPRTSSLPNPYARQKVAGTRGYRKDWVPLTPDQKLKAFRRRIGIQSPYGDERSGGLELLDFFETFEEVNILPISGIARHYVIPDPYHSGYPKILRVLADRLRAVLRDEFKTEFWSSVLEEFPFEKLELHPQAREALTSIEGTTPRECICFPAQFGLRWNGSSMERTTAHVGQPDSKVALVCREFPLPAYVVLCELIADPARLLHQEVLNIDCPGDVVTDSRGEHFRGGLCFSFRNKRLHLSVRPRQAADAECGTATGLIGAKRQH